MMYTGKIGLGLAGGALVMYLGMATATPLT